MPVNISKLTKKPYPHNKMKSTLIISLFLLSAILNAQVRIQGFVLDKATSKPISFAIVSDKNQKYGCYTDTIGKFILNSASLKDTLKISNLGYKTLYVSVNDIKPDDKFLLESDPFRLKEVIVIPTDIKPKELKIGFFDRHPNLVSAVSYPINLQAILIPFPEGRKRILIKSVDFTYSLVSRNYPMRIRILQVDENGAPGNDLIAENIILKNYKSGHLRAANIDVSSYNIYMPQNGVFIVFEWLMDKPFLEPKDDPGIDGPYIGSIKSPNELKSHWSKDFYRTKWIEVQSRSYLSVGLTVADYTTK